MADTSSKNPWEYQPGKERESRYEGTINNLTEEYAKRGPFSFSDFSYDPNSDKAFQDYADIMRKNGNLAMKDTMAKAASMTGGYASSAAQTAGQQMYNNFVDQIGLAEGQFYDRALSKYNAEYDRAFAKYNAEGNDLLTKLGLYQGLEDTDRANWESDYARAWNEENRNYERTWNEALNKATYAGDYSGLAALLNVSAETLVKNAQSAGKKEFGEDQANKYLEALLQGNGEAYLDELELLGYDTSNAYALRNSWEDNGEIAKVIGVGNDEHAATWGQFRNAVNDNISGVANTNEGQLFHVNNGNTIYNVKIGKKVASDDDIGAYASQNNPYGLIVFNNSLYYGDGGGNIFEVDAGGGHEGLIKYILGGN